MNSNIYNLIDTLGHDLAAALAQLDVSAAIFPSLSTSQLVAQAAQSRFGHYQSNCALQFSKHFNCNPRKLAEKIVSLLPAEHYMVTVAGPGFINFSFFPEFLANYLIKMSNCKRLGHLSAKPSQNIIIDFSSPNIAKEMHVGHLRSTIIGDSLARVLEFNGHKITRLNHLGDWGTQFGMLLAYLADSNSNIATLDVAALQQCYRAAKQRFDTDQEFALRAKQDVVALQQGNPQHIAYWQQLCDISQQAFTQIYDLLDIKLIARGESFYRDMLAEVVADFTNAGLLVESDGAKCCYLPGFSNRDNEPLPLIIQKSDGGYNYTTTDLAALKHRCSTEQAQHIIYVTDAGQSLHFAMLFAAARKVGYVPKDVTLTHVPFGLVLREDGKKFKTRSGDTERLIDLINAAKNKAYDVLQAKTTAAAKTARQDNQDLHAMAHNLGINALKYADLHCNRQSDYHFSYAKMLKFEGNTAAFVNYAYVRSLSITKHCAAHDNLSLPTIKLIEPLEIELALKLCQFHEAVQATSDTLLPNRLTDYLYQLAETFHGFFHACRVKDSEHEASRLALCDLTSKVLLCGMQLLGLKPLPHM